MKTCRGSIVSGAFFLIAGCASNLGPANVAPSGYQYNQAIAQTKDEQLLLNLVRLRYRDTIVFMDIGGVTSQQSYSASASASIGFPLNRLKDGSAGLSPEIEFSSSPTISYQPQRGAEFARKLLSPIGAETIVLLANSGWSIERLLMCCVEKLGDLSNAPSASGPTPPDLPDNHDFRELSNILRQLQRKERVSVEQVNKNENESELSLVVDAKGSGDCRQLEKYFDRPGCEWRFKLKEYKSTLNENLFTQTRTVLGALYTLSHGVDVPSAHLKRGIVTQSEVVSTQTQTWIEFLSGQFRVRTSESEPEFAAVKVFYRDHWFWIEDSDLESKTTFNLLDFLIALQSAAENGSTPLLLVSSGR